MGGELQVSSTLSKGSRFWFDLRMATGERPADAINQPDDVLDLSALKILYAEDNLMNQKVMSLLLKTYGIVPVLANNGKEALDLLEKTPFDVVLMDFRMPEMDGFEATERIRAFVADHINHNIPILGVSADVFDESTAKGLALGMNATLAKPIDKNQLESALIKYLRQSQRAINAKEAN
jgi:CheY-like chemotaxis protein